MKSCLPLSAAALALALGATSAHAQTIKPGLWEMNSKIQSDDAQVNQAVTQMQKQLATMDPAQRKMIEDMMAKQGVSLGGVDGNAVTVKICVTKEMAAQRQLPMHSQGSCTQTSTPIVNNTMHVSMSCTNPPSSGEGQVVFTSDTAYKANMRMMSKVADKMRTITVDATGRWLASDCGAVAAPTMPPAAR